MGSRVLVVTAVTWREAAGDHQHLAHILTHEDVDEDRVGGAGAVLAALP